MHDFDFNTLLGPTAGGGVALLIIRMCLKKADEILTRMQSMHDRLVIMDAKLQNLEQIEDLVRKHDRKIAYFESKLDHSNVNQLHRVKPE